MIAQRMRRLRVDKHWTQEDLAKKLNMAISTISGYENGSRRPDIETLIRLSDLFEVSVDYLIGRSNQTHDLTAGAPMDADDVIATTIDLTDLHRLERLSLLLDEQPLTVEDKQYMLAIIREKRNAKRRQAAPKNTKTDVTEE
jgi:transcriptional regulator with XRE-family HTH domain